MASKMKETAGKVRRASLTMMMDCQHLHGEIEKETKRIENEEKHGTSKRISAARKRTDFLSGSGSNLGMSGVLVGATAGARDSVKLRSDGHGENLNSSTWEERGGTL
jgi:hypothetical protein